MILDTAFWGEHGECLEHSSETDSGLQYLIREENTRKKRLQESDLLQAKKETISLGLKHFHEEKGNNLQTHRG